MAANLIEADKVYEIDYIDASGSGCFNKCPAQYFFERVFGLENQDRDTTAMDYGTDIHAVLAMCYGAVDSANENYMLEEVMNRLKELRKDRGFNEEDKKHSIEHTEPRLREFIELHAQGVCPYKIVHFPFTAPEGADVISDNEVPFAIDIGGLLPFIGRIDLPVELTQTNELWACDYKTASEISGRLWECFELNTQAIGYTLALSQLANRRATGMLIEAIRKSANIKKTEIALHYQYVTDYDIELFVGYMNNTAAHIKICNERKGWNKKLSGCSCYPTTGIPGGSCPYKMLCKADDWRTVVQYYHQKEPFHPFKVS
jgi:hypothetical protein